jgi:hypothetical protein
VPCIKIESNRPPFSKLCEKPNRGSLSPRRSLLPRPRPYAPSWSWAAPWDEVSRPSPVRAVVELVSVMGKERQRCRYSRISHLGRRRQARKGAGGRGGRRRGGGRLADVWQERGRGGKAAVASHLMFHFWWPAGGESVCGVLHLTHSFHLFMSRQLKFWESPICSPRPGWKGLLHCAIRFCPRRSKLLRRCGETLWWDIWLLSSYASWVCFYCTGPCLLTFLGYKISWILMLVLCMIVLRPWS